MASYCWLRLAIMRWTMKTLESRNLPAQLATQLAWTGEEDTQRNRAA